MGGEYYPDGKRQANYDIKYKRIKEIRVDVGRPEIRFRKHIPYRNHSKTKF